MNRLRLLLIVIGLVCTVPSAAEWKVLDARWRPDANSFAERQVWEGWRWSEGWGHDEQFYPGYFKPSGSAHIYLRNDSSEPQEIVLSAVDGIPIQDLITTPRKAGRVIWYRLECPQLPTTEASETRLKAKKRTIPPGQWVECGVRFRHPPARDVRLLFSVGARGMEVPVAVKPPRVRLESVSFSPRIDRLYLYVRSLEGHQGRTGRLALDGRDASRACRWEEGPKGSGLTLAEVKLDPPWEYGSCHLIEVCLPNGEKLVQHVRAWDCYFSIGLFGSTKREHVREAKEEGFNTYYWSDPTTVYELGMNDIPWNHNYGLGRKRTVGGYGALFYYNIDEPDCHDWTLGGDLPPMERLGVHAEETVLPRIEQQRKRDSSTPGMVLVDNTYKPANYYVYGQIPDVFASDPYQLLGLDQLPYVRHVIEAARDASTPRPVVAVLWTSGFVYNRRPKTPIPPGEGDAKVRPPSPEEERMMAFYALGAGAKGIGYFGDFRDYQGLDTPEGRYVQLSEHKPLWEEVGRINRDIAALAPYLSIGCPAPVRLEDEKVWASIIMCGPDRMALIVVNKDHYIGYNTRNAYAWHSPALDVKLSVPLPPSFSGCRVQELRDGKLIPSQAEVKGGKAHLSLDTVDTARAFVISRG